MLEDPGKDGKMNIFSLKNRTCLRSQEEVLYQGGWDGYVASKRNKCIEGKKTRRQDAS
jgi:hypothetical protein